MHTARVPDTASRANRDTIRNTAVVSCDSRYAPAAAVAVRSLLDTYAGDVPLEVVVVCRDDDGSTVRRLGTSFASDPVALVELGELVPPDLPARSYFGNAAVYVRLALDDLLPGRSRALYLDADTLTQADVSDVWRTDLHSAPLGAVVEMFAPTVAHPDALWNAHEVDLDPETPYFNSGVLLVDLDVWRAQSLQSRCLAYIDEFGARCRYPDQDALNHVVAGNWEPLDPSFNCSPFWDRPKYDVTAHGDVVGRARILHFVGESKPWHPGYAHAGRRAQFLDVLGRTEFATSTAEAP